MLQVPVDDGLAQLQQADGKAGKLELPNGHPVDNDLFSVAKTVHQYFNYRLADHDASLGEGCLQLRAADRAAGRLVVTQKKTVAFIQVDGQQLRLSIGKAALVVEVVEGQQSLALLQTKVVPTERGDRLEQHLQVLYVDVLVLN